MVPRYRLLPRPRPNDRAVAQQGARVLVEKRLRVARHVEAAAPDEHVLLHGLDVLRVSLHARNVGMRIVDIIGELLRVIESSPGIGHGGRAPPNHRAALLGLIAQNRPRAGPRGTPPPPPPAPPRGFFWVGGGGRGGGRGRG